ncbi:MAG: nucleotidyltransferase family protein [Deltaproteobacteria bacterium]|nr:nucleotidyltransferase family protein [Deltaproteobacteria bacterium]MCL5277911.1 nucleotidyltransferase family protein [Deltaproteobacteria bacterium]
MTELFDPLRKLLLDTCSPVKSAEQARLLRLGLGLARPEKLLRLASREYLSPLLYYSLKPLHVPGYDWLLPRLKESYLKNTARNVLLLKWLKSLKREAGKDDIQMILLKGAGLAISAYNEVGLRPMADVDILVHQHHAGRVREIMEHSNMRPLFQDTNQDWLFSIKSHMVPYQSDDGILSLEVHTRLFDDRFIRFPELDPFEGTLRVDWDNEPFFVLDPYRAFVYGLYHSAVHHNFMFTLRDVLDLAYLVSYYGIDSEKVASVIGNTHARGLLMPLVDAAFGLSGRSKTAQGSTSGTGHAYLYWTNSVVMRRLPIQISSRLSDATLRAAVVLTGGIKEWSVRAFKPTGYELSIFYKSERHGGPIRRSLMILWTIGVCVIYIAVLPLFCIKIKGARLTSPLWLRTHEGP